MKMSNLRIKSNVYLRDPVIPRLIDDAEFLPHVRGFQALAKLLTMLGITRDRRSGNDPRIARWLTVNQRKALNWELRCSQCDTIPGGITFEGPFENRCPIVGCSANPNTNKPPQSPIRPTAVAAKPSSLTKARQTSGNSEKSLDPDETITCDLCRLQFKARRLSLHLKMMHPEHANSPR